MGLVRHALAQAQRQPVQRSAVEGRAGSLVALQARATSRDGLRGAGASARAPQQTAAPAAPHPGPRAPPARAARGLRPHHPAPRCSRMSSHCQCPQPHSQRSVRARRRQRQRQQRRQQARPTLSPPCCPPHPPPAATRLPFDRPDVAAAAAQPCPPRQRWRPAHCRSHPTPPTHRRSMRQSRPPPARPPAWRHSARGSGCDWLRASCAACGRAAHTRSAQSVVACLQPRAAAAHAPWLAPDQQFVRVVLMQDP